MIHRRGGGRPAHRRRTGNIKSNALIRRLRLDRRASRAHDHNFAQLTPERVNRSLKRPGVRAALLAVFALAALIGSLISKPVVTSLERTLRQTPRALDTIAVQGNRRLSSDEVAVATGLPRHAAVASIDTSQIVARLIAHPWIRHAEVLYLPAGRLLVRIEERQAEIAIATPDADSDAPVWHLVDREGIAFARANAEDLVGLARLRSDRAPLHGEPDQRLVEAIALTDLFPALSLRDPSPATAQSLELPTADSEAGWVLHFESPDRRVILGRDDLETRLARLALLLEADLESTRAAGEIDLRFAERAILRSTSASW